MAETAQPPYSETTDLYLQLLGDAQRMEDQRMVKMVLRKLRSCGYCHGSGAAEGDVIAFPARFSMDAGKAPSDLFWQDIFFWQNLVQFLILLVAGTAWLTLPFILVAKLIKG